MFRSLRPVGPLLSLLVCLWGTFAHAASLEVHFIDVGQGDGILIRSPGGKTVLLDAGNTEAGPVVDAYLTRLGVTTLDLAVVSHPHLDHMGGMQYVLQRHKPRNYVDPGFMHPLDAYSQLLEWLEAQQVPVRKGEAGRTIQLEPGVQLRLVAPEQPFLKGTRSDANSNSVVARLTYGDVSFLFTGDAEDETEERILRHDENMSSTVLKVAHHGGRYSTSDTWIARIQPRFAVISCGAVNSYGHPTADTLGRLERRDVRVFRTDRDGDVIARTDGTKIDWQTTGEASATLDSPGGPRSFGGKSRGDESHHGHGRKAEAVPTLQVRDASVSNAPVSGTGLDLNTATADQLEALPGIGPALAGRMVAYRAAHGGFRTVDELDEVDGIGAKLLEKIRPHVRVVPLVRR